MVVESEMDDVVAPSCSNPECCICNPQRLVAATADEDEGFDWASSEMEQLSMDDDGVAW